MMTMLKKFWMEEDGGESVEWPLVVGLIAVVAIAVMVTIGEQVNEVFKSIYNALMEVPEYATGG